MKFWIVSLTIVSMMFALTACGRSKPEAMPTPTAIPVIEVDDADDDGAAESEAETVEVEAAEAEEATEVDVEEVDVEEAVDTEAPESDGEDTETTESETTESETTGPESSASTESVATAGQGQGGQGQGRMGGGNGGMGPQMRDRHMAPIPAEYAGLTSPVAADADSLALGKTHFELFCASCHGNEGLGDGPAAVALDPAPPMLAQTALMTGDDYLFWRISEGGAMEPFSSAMPAWKEILDEQARWDIINYARSLGGMHGNADAGAMREEMQATMQAEMLASAQDLGVIDQDEADIFMDVHGRIDAYQASLGDASTGNMDEVLDELLTGMVENDELTQEEADAFADIHARLDEAGVMQ